MDKINFIIKTNKTKSMCFYSQKHSFICDSYNFWILFGVLSYHFGVKYNAPEPYTIKDVLWELKNSYFTSVVLALLITGYSQNVGYKKRLYVQHNLYVDTMYAFDCIFEQFVGDELYHYMPFYNDICLKDTQNYMESNPLKKDTFSSEEFKGNLEEVLDGIQKLF